MKAVVFDLDDTLYPEIDYVRSGFFHVGKEMEKRFGIRDAYKMLNAYFSADRRDVYGRVLRDCGAAFNEDDIADFIEIYRTHTPELALSHEVYNTLLTLRKRGYRLGIITDGRPFQQWAKIRALGLNELVDTVIVTDELGGIALRKPEPAAFRIMCERLGVPPEEVVYVGDNPQKDFAVKRHLPIATVMVKSGLYREEAFLYDIRPDITLETFSDITKIVL